MSAWQPIETAPKDGPVLLWSPDAIDPGVMIGFWLHDPEDPRDSGWHDFWDDSAPPIDAEPTHWQPLPAAPQEASDA